MIACHGNIHPKPLHLQSIVCRRETNYVECTGSGVVLVLTTRAIFNGYCLRKGSFSCGTLVRRTDQYNAAYGVSRS